MLQIVRGLVVGVVVFGLAGFNPQGKEQPPPAGAAALQPKIRARLGDGLKTAVLAVAVSPDGRTVAAGLSDKSVKLWDLAADKSTALLGDFRGEVRSVVFSPNGKLLATVDVDLSASSGKAEDQARVRVWDVASGKTLALVPSSVSNPRVAFSPDSKTLAVTGGSTSFVAWPGSGGLQSSWPPFPPPVQRLNGFGGSPGYGTTGNLPSLPGKTGTTTKPLSTLNPNQPAFGDLGLQPSPYKPIASNQPPYHPLYQPPYNPLYQPPYGYGTTKFTARIQLVEAATGTFTAKLDGGGAWDALAFAPDGKTLASAGKTHVNFWNLAAGKARVSFNVPEFKTASNALMRAIYLPDGKTLAVVMAKADNEVMLYIPGTGDETSFTGLTQDVTALALSDDGKKLAAGSKNATIRIWDVADSKKGATLKGHTDTVTSLAFSSDGKTLVSGSTDRTIGVWDVSTGKMTRRWDAATGDKVASIGHSGPVYSMAFSPDGKTLASASFDHTIKLWDVASAVNTATLAGHQAAVVSVAFSPDGKTLASRICNGRPFRTSFIEDKTIRVWDVATHQNTVSIQANDELFAPVAFSPDGKLLASVDGPGGREIRFWDPATGKVSRAMRGEIGFTSIAFSPDGKALAATTREKVSKGAGKIALEMWNQATGEKLATYETRVGLFCGIAFSPDSKTLVSGSNPMVKLWDVATGKDLATLERLGKGQGSIRCVAFSPDGKTVAAGNNNRTVKLWKVSGELLVTLENPRQFNIAEHTGDGQPLSAVNCIAFSPDGRTLAMGCNDGTIKLWDVGSSS